jgi:hypothetical protein
MVSLGRGAWAALVCVALLTGGGRGLCFMQAVPSDGAMASDGHECCKKGLNERAPGCCHAQPGSDSLATVKKTTGTPLPAAVGWTSPAAMAWVPRDPLNPRLGVSHSPPPTVLRI